jgi:hypothetical protein
MKKTKPTLFLLLELGVSFEHSFEMSQNDHPRRRLLFRLQIGAYNLDTIEVGPALNHRLCHMFIVNFQVERGSLQRLYCPRYMCQVLKVTVSGPNVKSSHHCCDSFYYAPFGALFHPSKVSQYVNIPNSTTPYLHLDKISLPRRHRMESIDGQSASSLATRLHPPLNEPVHR